MKTNILKGFAGGEHEHVAVQLNDGSWVWGTIHVKPQSNLMMLALSCRIGGPENGCIGWYQLNMGLHRLGISLTDCWVDNPAAVKTMIAREIEETQAHTGRYEQNLTSLRSVIDGAKGGPPELLQILRGLEESYSRELQQSLASV